MALSLSHGFDWLSLTKWWHELWFKTVFESFNATKMSMFYNYCTKLQAFQQIISFGASENFPLQTNSMAHQLSICSPNQLEKVTLLSFALLQISRERTVSMLNIWSTFTVIVRHLRAMSWATDVNLCVVDELLSKRRSLSTYIHTAEPIVKWVKCRRADRLKFLRPPFMGTIAPWANSITMPPFMDVFFVEFTSP